MRTTRLLISLFFIVLGMGFALEASAQTAATAQSPQSTTAPVAEESPGSLLTVVLSGGWIGFLIILLLFFLSIGAMALAVEHMMTIRENVLMPPGLADQVRTHLVSGDLPSADKACRAEPSFLAFVLQAALAETDGGWPAVEKALEDATAEQAARLFRKIEYLSVIGNIAPMIGLLGTVTGMIFAFQEVAATQGAARAAGLAEGIYTALITTVGGLIVAIPSLAGFAVFRNRVDQLVAETAYVSLRAIGPLKRLRGGRQRAAAPPGAAPPSAGPPADGGR